jgi:hypothetical protein
VTSGVWLEEEVIFVWATAKEQELIKTQQGDCVNASTVSSTFVAA